jgi:beta-phosphoglucomutase-like phosphatase (HAD superfamily)
MMSIYKALIFDMDGVLVDSEPLHQRDWLTVFRGFGLEYPASELKALQGLKGEQVIELVKRRVGAPADSVDFEALIAEKAGYSSSRPSPSCARCRARNPSCAPTRDRCRSLW